MLQEPSASSLCALVATTLIAVSLPAQRTWVVDLTPGPGVDFTDIPPAIAAASSGDRIEVRGPTLWAMSYSPFLVSKALDIEATASASVRYFRVENLKSTEGVSIRGFVCRPTPSWGNQDESVLLRNCAGPVMLADVNILGGGDRPGFRIEDCGRVALQSSYSSSFSAGQFPGNPSLVAVRSGVSIVGCSLTGGPGSSAGGGTVGFEGGTGLVAEGSSIYARNCVVRGGDAGYASLVTMPGGHAVEVDATSEVILAACTLHPGLGRSGSSDGDAVRGPARLSECIATGVLTNGALTIGSLPSLQSDLTASVGSSLAVRLGSSSGTVGLLAFALGHSHETYPGVAMPVLLTADMVALDLVAIPRHEPARGR